MSNFGYFPGESKIILIIKKEIEEETVIRLKGDEC